LVKSQLILVAGPAGSGKSELAESLAAKCDGPVVYVATANCDPEDAEWQQKLLRHQQRRPSDWQTQEVPILLPQVLMETTAGCLLVDSLGTWVANLLEQPESVWQETLKDLQQSLTLRQTNVIMVAEEVGWGVVPAYPLGRLFRDRLGQTTRLVGGLADQVYLVAAGCVVNLKDVGLPLIHYLGGEINGYNARS
jgi:adenosylcobinamide kinase/adenosylcobinamide-phosphate guanylyltransferase